MEVCFDVRMRWGLFLMLASFEWCTTHVWVFHMFLGWLYLLNARMRSPPHRRSHGSHGRRWMVSDVELAEQLSSSLKARLRETPRVFVGDAHIYDLAVSWMREALPHLRLMCLYLTHRASDCDA
jgi:hypothetical protein